MSFVLNIIIFEIKQLQIKQTKQESSIKLILSEGPVCFQDECTLFKQPYILFIST
jgi:hypothetical protein